MCCDCWLVLSEYPWSKDLHNITGFSVRALSQCVFHLHRKWYVHRSLCSCDDNASSLLDSLCLCTQHAAIGNAEGVPLCHVWGCRFWHSISMAWKVKTTQGDIVFARVTSIFIWWPLVYELRYTVVPKMNFPGQGFQKVIVWQSKKWMPPPCRKYLTGYFWQGGIHLFDCQTMTF